MEGEATDKFVATAELAQTIALSTNTSMARFQKECAFSIGAITPLASTPNISSSERTSTTAETETARVETDSQTKRIVRRDTHTTKRTQELENLAAEHVAPATETVADKQEDERKNV